jgi:hypothetical protein
MVDYVVQFKCETRNGDTVTGLAAGDEELELSLEPDGSLIVSFSTSQPSAVAAIAAGREVADRTCRLVGLAFGAYQVVGLRLATSPRAASLSSVSWTSPSATARDTEHGGIMLVSASGSVHRNVAGELSRAGIWHKVPKRLRAAIDVFWQAQLSEIQDVRFVLLMAVLDILVSQAPSGNLLKSQLDEQGRTVFLDEIRRVCDEADLGGEFAQRLVERTASTANTSARVVRTNYIGSLTEDGFGFGVITLATVNSWLKARNAYIHGGARIPIDLEIGLCNAIVGSCINAEVELVALT